MKIALSAIAVGLVFGLAALALGCVGESQCSGAWRGLFNAWAAVL